MTVEINSPGMELPEEITPVEMSKGDQALNNEVARNAIEIINQTDYEKATKDLVISAIKEKDIAFIRGTLHDLKFLEEELEENRDEYNVTIDLENRIAAMQKIYDAMLLS